MKNRMGLGLIGLSLLAVAACNPNGSGGLGGLFGNGSNTRQVAAFLPEGITLQTTELPMDDTGAAKTANQDVVTPTLLGYRRSIYTDANIVYGFHIFADEALALGASIRLDMTSTTQTQVEGKFTVNGQSVSYRADFAAFDFDGDGKPDGSGNAVDLPVAVRVWTDPGSGFQPFLCALVTTKPSTDNIGVGAMYAKPSAANADAYRDLQMFVKWDRTDAAHQWNEAVLVGQVGPFYRVQSCRARVDIRVNKDNTIEKTARATAGVSDSPWGFTSISSSTHWQQLGVFALVSAQATGGSIQVGFSNVCLDLAQRTVATNGECNTFDTQDMTFVAAPTSTEANFPKDFPATPTFGGAAGG